MVAALPLLGRSGIISLFKELLRRNGRDLPLTVLIGPPGSGKSWVLQYIERACGGSAAIPYAFVDCAERNYTPWQLVCRLADELSGSWPEFGAIRFRRVWLALVAVSITDLSDDPGDTTNCSRVREELRRRVRIRERADVASRAADEVGLILDARQALDVSPAEVRLVGNLLRSAISSRYAVDALFRTGLNWYGERGKRGDSGVDELVRLNLSFHDTSRRREAERTLVAAFLADIEAAYSRRKRPFNCVVLLDNCHEEAGRTVLDLVAHARATSAVCDPVVVVAAAGALPELTGLRGRWQMPWETKERATSARKAARQEVPTSRSVSYVAWSGSRDREMPGSWWLPVRLCNLTPGELARSIPDEHVRFLSDLTNGHPWSVRELASALSEPRSRRAVLDGLRYDYLLTGLPDRLHGELVCWSAARDIDAAAGALSARHSDLSDWLEKSLWLTAEDPLRRPRIHPWLRRVLLWQLARTGKDRWNAAHGRLRDWAAVHRKVEIDIWYHSLACGEVGTAVDHLLDQQQNGADAESWIEKLNGITAAPGLHHHAENAEARYDELLALCPDETGPRRVVWSLVAARWIWADPLGDPGFTLTHAIADEFVLLADVFETGRNRFHQEARKYRELTS